MLNRLVPAHVLKRTCLGLTVLLSYLNVGVILSKSHKSVVSSYESEKSYTLNFKIAIILFSHYKLGDVKFELLVDIFFFHFDFVA